MNELFIEYSIIYQTFNKQPKNGLKDPNYLFWVLSKKMYVAGKHVFSVKERLWRKNAVFKKASGGEFHDKRILSAVLILIRPISRFSFSKLEVLFSTRSRCLQEIVPDYFDLLCATQNTSG